MISYLIWSGVALRFILFYFSFFFFHLISAFNLRIALSRLLVVVCIPLQPMLFPSQAWYSGIRYSKGFCFSFFIFSFNISTKQLWIAKLVNWMKRTSRIKNMKMRKCFQWICGMRYGDWAKARRLVFPHPFWFSYSCCSSDRKRVKHSDEHRKATSWKSSFIFLFASYIESHTKE